MMSDRLDFNILREKLLEYLREDIGFGDLTTNPVVPPDLLAEAIISLKSDGIVAGIRESLYIFELAGIDVIEHVYDGAAAHGGQIVAKVRGPARSILTVERTVLNLLMRMSGIATITRKMVDEARSVSPSIKIACTRKTTPGFRLFEKRAVELGGGDTHRLRLDDAILIKSNHIVAAGGVKEAIDAARSGTSFTKKLEVEAASIDEAVEAAKCGSDILMLDNMTPEEVERTISTLTDMDLRSKLMIEVSGGVTPENLKAYATVGADVISVGLLTHSARALDINLRITKTWTSA
jgi:nicotinate-nucleotide pyrophosphorylase (carboxylating)